MRIHTSLPVAFLSIGILAGCSDQEITAPETTTSALEAPTVASFQRNVTQVSFGNLISALVNIDAKVSVLNNADIDINNVEIVTVDDVIVKLNDVQISLLNAKIQDVDVNVSDVIDIDDVEVDLNVDLDDVNIIAIDVNVATGDITLLTVSDATVSEFGLDTLDL